MLRSEEGNVSRAARALGLHRNQLRRYLVKYPELAASEDEKGDKAGEQSDGKSDARGDGKSDDGPDEN